VPFYNLRILVNQIFTGTKDMELIELFKEQLVINICDRLNIKYEEYKYGQDEDIINERIVNLYNRLRSKFIRGLESTNFEVSIYSVAEHYSDEQIKKYGLIKDDEIFLCRKENS
jgi:hypothetical protein